ncbi:hypothetical protein SRB5_58000 [Streptomyces sp. RB5]|uniref:Alpha/beta hydrolase n=1 Tax=Streptomyces smaragdinus TaxID=2585196 RepID=A0A7K0CSB0_9ACTN|nr:alpha/beta fold hydrolase [Streptomyces smaragdinus]MQY15614.1 hypothetical protein [Streptomyces smaragdinus]
MVAYVIIPGIDGSDERHWQTLWEREWGDRAVRIAPRSWSQPGLPDWIDAVRKAYATAARRDPRVVLVAHSLGCWAASACLALGTPAAGALLVAPPDPRGPAFPDRATTFRALTAEQLPCPAVLVSSTDDPYCTPDRSAGFAARWGARHHEPGAYGHLNSASGLGSWPYGREVLPG